PQGFLDSDILLLGVSRTSKTPVSMYLANQGYRVSNLPLIPEVPLPPILEEMDPQKMIGLVCSPETLGQIRSSRLASLGLGNETSYTNVERIEQELAYAEEIFAKYGIPVIDVTAKSVEETAFLIKEKLDERN
ncbi:MAG TPA: kinase/pyrophosphorylase, partial [Enterococcus faecalis]|nr:kinase/pyrophosphorylase [Enterococcus faecalis]